MVVALFMDDEAAQLESDGALVTYVLRQTHTAVLYTVDKRTHGPAVRGREVVEALHQDSHALHQHCRYGVVAYSWTAHL